MFCSSAFGFSWDRLLCHLDPDLSWTHLYVQNLDELRCKAKGLRCKVFQNPIPYALHLLPFAEPIHHARNNSCLLFFTVVKRGDLPFSPLRISMGIPESHRTSPHPHGFPHETPLRTHRPGAASRRRHRRFVRPSPIGRVRSANSVGHELDRASPAPVGQRVRAALGHATALARRDRAPAPARERRW